MFLLIASGSLVPHWASAQSHSPVARPYWPVTVEQVPTTAHTHIKVTGRVRLVRREDDGDLHIKLTGTTGFIVAECIPALPCPQPPVGQRITVYGISREDKEHRWYEVHPVERWELAP